MRDRALRSKTIIPVLRLALSLSFFFYVGIWPHRPCNYDNYFLFDSMHKLSFDDEFCIVYVLCVCMYVAFVFATLRTCGCMNGPLRCR